MRVSPIWTKEDVYFISNPLDCWLDNQLFELYLPCHREQLYKVWASTVFGLSDRTMSKKIIIIQGPRLDLLDLGLVSGSCQMIKDDSFSHRSVPAWVSQARKDQGRIVCLPVVWISYNNVPFFNQWLLLAEYVSMYRRRALCM